MKLSLMLLEVTYQKLQFLGGLDVNGKGVDSFDDGSDVYTHS